jgi:hypothetical protein
MGALLEKNREAAATNKTESALTGGAERVAKAHAVDVYVGYRRWFRQVA